MRFKVDENLPVEVADELRAIGHDAATVGQQNLGGASDTRVAEVCRREQRTLVTLDLDFSDIRKYAPEEYAGLIVLRLSRQDKPHVLAVARRMFPLLLRQPLAGRLWIVEEQGVRMRGDRE